MDRIRELRAIRGVSQAKLAVTAGMDPATLNRIEQGKGNPNLKTLEKLAEALGVGVVDLLEEAPKAQAQLPFEESEQLRTIPEALNSYMKRRAKSLEAELKDENSAHFFTATAATLWVADIQSEARDWADWAAEEAAAIMPQRGGLSDPEFWLDALKVLGHLMTFHAITRKAERRIAAMADQPDDLAKKRLEKASREAWESEHRLQGLQEASG